MAADSENRMHQRAPLATAVQIEHADLHEFLEEYSANISPGGMFIASQRPLAEGAVFDFRFSVSGDVTVISGRAEVVWTRHEQTPTGSPPGMGVKFLDLDDVSRAIILRVVDLYILQDGGEPFSLEPG